MLVLFFLFLLTVGLGFLFYLLTKSSIEQVYENLDDSNEFIRKTKAFFLGVFHLIAF